MKVYQLPFVTMNETNNAKEEYDDTTVIVPSVTSEKEMKLDEDDVISTFSLSLKVSDLDDVTIDSVMKGSLQNENNIITNPELIDEDDENKERSIVGGEKETQCDKESVTEHNSDTFTKVGKSLSSVETSTKKDIEANKPVQKKATVSTVTKTPPSSFFQILTKFVVMFFFLLLTCMILIVSSTNLFSSPTTPVVPESKEVVPDEGQYHPMTLRSFVKSMFTLGFTMLNKLQLMVTIALYLMGKILKSEGGKRETKSYSKQETHRKKHITQSRFKRFKRFPLDLKSIFMSRYKTEVVDNEGFVVEVTRSTRILNSPQGKADKSQARILNSPLPKTFK